MNRANGILALVLMCAAASSAAAADLNLTIYNQNFGVVRQPIHLSLKKGVASASTNDITYHVEPDSVILRDSRDGKALNIVEQNYRADPVTESLLLSLNEGKTIDFLVEHGDKEQVVQGKIVRSGYVPHSEASLQRYGYNYYQAQMGFAQPGSEQPIIEVDGKLRFSLPGKPLFPSLADDTILKPTLSWLIQSDRNQEVNAELGYVTGGMSWSADYNAVSPEKDDSIDLTGWITMDNQSGKSFDNASINLMAGDVNKIAPEAAGLGVVSGGVSYASRVTPPGVAEKPFEEFHLYSLPRATTLRDRETKQVEFVRASGVKTKKLYLYDGAKIDWQQYRGWGYQNIRANSEFGVASETKVAVLREFSNSESNGLGIPLPKGRMRFYRRDGGKLEFVGENQIDHTAKDETIRVFTGNAFDIVGERRRVSYNIDNMRSQLDESFEIKVRNHKKDAVEVLVRERLYRGENWNISAKSDAFNKIDSNTVEFPVQVRAGGEKTVTYSVHYYW